MEACLQPTRIRAAAIATRYRVAARSLGVRTVMAPKQTYEPISHPFPTAKSLPVTSSPALAGARISEPRVILRIAREGRRADDFDSWRGAEADGAERRRQLIVADRVLVAVPDAVILEDLRWFECPQPNPTATLARGEESFID